jgi:hypothetical protein
MAGASNVIGSLLGTRLALKHGGLCSDRVCRRVVSLIP